ncbi:MULTISPECIES: hypothetical protein [unclassified Bradyrhizobium]|uniref:hypothetical protein n=1 Tax=unclassified Bradyrhizobium TaxID=2631580 RepID=UPI00211F22ED|nr:MULTISPECIES: hypothetical protein [unclassified Bradyrhizobium]MDD1537824.1 hypothetical protein [Bradyrhizobium sp. WBOS8]MDD1587325.1 hypothetical protein [Bradyrhizobium sp. WBOS4]UUO46063.1 hypothetical protein DCM78_03390 [Bradyrhizobium sp. WBOS04]UUO59767.1 hypothetical protein DCM80_11620 [Bradyrhizobium sp. WBOS08]
MARWTAWAVAVVLAAGLPRAFAANRVAIPEASAGIAVLDARRPARTYVVPPLVRRDPHYYARPVRYRPYPYGVPAPFVFGYGPFW